MSGYPPSVTQRDIDEAAGAYDERQRCTVCGQMRDSPCREGDCGNEPIDDEPCFACGGAGCFEDECTCGDDTCCCLYPDPPICDECKGTGWLP